MIVRIFTTSVDPDDVDESSRLFETEVRPAFEKFDGCLGIDWYIGIDEHSGDLVDVTAISRWDSTDAIAAATASAEYKEALSGLRRLFRESPIVHHYRPAG
ncbi:MAG: antibiotic biosynthesis monooxygenase [Actinomycetota bacterium]|nr:antibiotic biosynthesis monooxygenase [Actinomycetota bacterium]